MSSLGDALISMADNMRTRKARDESLGIQQANLGLRLRDEQRDIEGAKNARQGRISAYANMSGRLRHIGTPEAIQLANHIDARLNSPDELDAIGEMYGGWGEVIGNQTEEAAVIAQREQIANRHQSNVDAQGGNDFFATEEDLRNPADVIGNRAMQIMTQFPGIKWEQALSQARADYDREVNAMKPELRKVGSDDGTGTQTGKFDGITGEFEGNAGDPIQPHRGTTHEIVTNPDGTSTIKIIEGVRPKSGSVMAEQQLARISDIGSFTNSAGLIGKMFTSASGGVGLLGDVAIKGAGVASQMQTFYESMTGQGISADMSEQQIRDFIDDTTSSETPTRWADQVAKLFSGGATVQEIVNLRQQAQILQSAAAQALIAEKSRLSRDERRILERTVGVLNAATSPEQALAALTNINIMIAKHDMVSNIVSGGTIKNSPFDVSDVDGMVKFRSALINQGVPETYATHMTERLAEEYETIKYLEGTKKGQAPPEWAIEGEANYNPNVK